MAIIYFVVSLREEGEVNLCCRYSSVVFYDVIDDCIIVQLLLLDRPCLVPCPTVSSLISSDLSTDRPLILNQLLMRYSGKIIFKFVFLQ